MNIIKHNLIFGTLTKRKSTEQIILHHAVMNGTVDDVHRIHKNNGFGGIGYHFYVRKDGSIYAGRPIDMIGAHARGSNFNSVGICFEGNFENETMTDAQKNAGKEIVAYVKELYGITIVKCHREVNATDCPGKNFPFEEIANATSNHDSWKQNEKGWWYQYADGTYPKSSWLELDAWYYFDENGYAICNTWKQINNKWYYFDENCRMVTGIFEIGNEIYYFAEDGHMCVTNDRGALV